jgi:hypothetical protein
MACRSRPQVPLRPHLTQSPAPQVFPSVEEDHEPQDRQRAIGTIVCKQDYHKGRVNRGYIAMLSVDKGWRRRGIGECDLCADAWHAAVQVLQLRCTDYSVCRSEEIDLSGDAEHDR